MRHEDERGLVAEAQTLADLRLVTVGADAIRFEVSVQLGERPRHIALLSGARDAALRIADDRLIAIDDVRQRPQREKYRSRIAARVRDELRGLQLTVAPLRQSVDRRVE